jgi:hypothetical protein
MAWTTPRTWANNETVNDTIMNAHVRDNLNFLYRPGAWASYTPTVSGFTSVVTTTAGYWQQAGQIVFARVEITLGTVTTLGSSTITVSLPVTAQTTGAITLNSTPIGSGIFDANAANPTMAIPQLSSSTTFRSLVGAGTYPAMSTWTGAAPSGQANGDKWFFTLAYEAA